MPAETDDLAVAMKALGSARLAMLVLTLLSVPVTPGWPWWAMLLVAPQTAFSLVLLLRWDWFAAQFLHRWWWPVAEGLMTMVLLMTLGPVDVDDSVANMTLILVACAVGGRVLWVIGVLEAAFIVFVACGLVPGLAITEWARLARLLLLVWAWALAGLNIRRLSIERGRALRAQAVLKAQEAAERERIRAAEEVHDGLTKSLEGGRMMATVLARELSSNAWAAKWAQLARELSEALVEAVDNSRLVLRSLRSGPPEDLSAACRLTIGRFAHTQPDINVDVDLPDDLGEVASLTRFEVDRALSELLENVRRHSRATTVSVSLRCDGETVSLRVSDNGVGLPEGFDVAAFDRTGHYGLIGLKEHTEKVGGAFRIASSADGAAVTVVFPVDVDIDLGNVSTECE